MPSMRRNGSPSISIRSAKVPLSPSSALQTTYFWSACVARDGAPFDPGRKAGAAASAQAGGHDLLDRRLGTHGQRAVQPGESAVTRRSRRAKAGRSRRSGRKRAAAAWRDRGSARSGRAPWDGRRRPETSRRTAMLRLRRRQAHNRDGPPASRLRPAAPARKGRGSRCGRSKARNCGRAPPAPAPRPRRPRRRRARRNPQERRRATFTGSVPSRSATIASSRSRSSRPTGSPSSSAAGESAQLPRQ